MAVKETLEAIVGIPITEWSWLKASLPSSRINLRSASLHAPAAYLASASCSQELVGKMLGRPSGCSPHIGSVVAALSASASRPDWQALCKRGCNTIVCATAYTSFIRLVYTISVYFRCASLYTKCILVFSTCLSTWWYISVFPCYTHACIRSADVIHLLYT